MKKLMIAAAIVCATVASQGAQILWKTSTSVKAPTSKTDGKFSGSTIGASTVDMYVWLVDSATYSSITDLSKIYTDYFKQGSTTGVIKDSTDKLAMASVTDKGGSSAISVTSDNLNFSTETPTTYYGLVLLTYESGDVKGYIANKATATIDVLGNKPTVNNLNKNIGGVSTADAITGWTMEAVPEPTSGLLLLLGVAGLALRRKQK